MKYRRMLLVMLAMLVCPVGSALGYEPAGTPEDWPAPMMVDDSYGMLLTDRLESGFADEADSYAWDIQGRYGGDRDRWWMKSEGHGAHGSSPEQAELQVLFGRLFSPFWEWQVGVRQDFRPQTGRSHLVFGLQGVAPYEFAIDTALFLSEKGRVSARVETEYDLRIAQRLVVQPRFEMNLAFSDDRPMGLGDGINDTELGMRLRYEIRREFAPYIGISWKRLYSETADLAEGRGEAESVTSLVIGIRAWF